MGWGGVWRGCLAGRVPEYYETEICRRVAAATTVGQQPTTGDNELTWAACSSNKLLQRSWLEPKLQDKRGECEKKAEPHVIFNSFGTLTFSLDTHTHIHF